MIRETGPCQCPIVEVGPPITSCPSQFMLFMTILEAYINGRCDLADPCHRFTSQGPPEDDYDFVVIGGGTAGSVITGRLAENPQWKILLIEAGPDEPTPLSVPSWASVYSDKKYLDWNYYSVKQKHACLAEDGKCFWPRAKMIGGCSSINGMVYIRGLPSDYDGWAANGATGWSWSDVFPYFLKSEDNKDIGHGVSGLYHCTGGPIPIQWFRETPQFARDVVSASIQLGYPITNDLNGKIESGFTVAQTFNNDGSRYSTARAYLRPVSRHPNLDVLVNTLVTRVIINPITKQVTAVEYLTNGKIKTVRVNKEVIISGGTMNSPQILMLSGIGPRETLNKFNIPVIQDLPGVGQNFQNHVGVMMNFTLTKEPLVPDLNWDVATQYLLSRSGPMSSNGLGQVIGRIQSRLGPVDGPYPDLEIYFYGYDAVCGSGAILPMNSYGEKRQILMSAVNINPLSRGYITIQSADPRVAPLMQPNYFKNERDLEIVIEGAKASYQLVNSPILQEKYGIEPTKGYGSECGYGGRNPSDEFLKCLAYWHTDPQNHMVGTCKMGPRSDPLAVVDLELKVHGVHGLRVVDASIMPRIISGNPEAAIIMIAERGADFIKSLYNYFPYSDEPWNRNHNHGHKCYAYHSLPPTQREHQPNYRPEHRWMPWAPN